MSAKVMQQTIADYFKSQPVLNRTINKRLIWVCMMFMPMFMVAGGTEPGRQYSSGTLPIIFINSEAPITTKEYYVNATCYIDALGQEGYESLGTAESPLALEIKGHGNHTWREYAKKPYRLKFQDKVKPLGMKKNRHFTLLPHADDDLVYLRNTVGFELSRLIGMAYTPAQEPVEVVLNGDYVGLYMLTEKICVGKNRVEITEQDDLATDPEKITGGWLLEIDNYESDDQIYIPNGDNDMNSVNITIQDPEVLSLEQRSYITTFIEDTDKAISSSDRDSKVWERYIDMDTLARYYIVREIVDDAESFRGSCFIHKERGNDTKLIFGPVWDFGNAFHRGRNKFIWQDPPYGSVWISKIYMFHRFKEHVINLWQPFLGMQYPKLDKAIDDFIDRIRYAVDSDLARWPGNYTGSIDSRKQLMKQYLSEKVAFLVSEWGEGSEQTVKKCETPTITLAGDKLSFACATEGVVYHYTISHSDVQNGASSKDVNLTQTYTITVYASKEGYNDSEVASATIKVAGSGLPGDVDGNGVVNVADHVELSKIILGQGQ